MIAVIDYQAGNLRSVELAFARIGAEACVTGDPAVITAADGAVLPGVGAFADAMGALRCSGLIPVIREFAASGRPFLGICLGMQALFDESEEGEGAQGLGLIPGRVRRLPDCGLKIPRSAGTAFLLKRKALCWQGWIRAGICTRISSIPMPASPTGGRMC